MTDYFVPPPRHPPQPPRPPPPPPPLPPPVYTSIPVMATPASSQPVISSGIAIAILVVLGAFILLFFIKFYNSCTDSEPEPASRPTPTGRRQAAKKGLSAEVISSIPVRQFRESDAEEECVVCLGDFDSDEVLKDLPKCGHTFHVDCIDKWLSLRTTCPVCRVSLKPPSTNAGTERSSSLRDRSSAGSLNLSEAGRGTSEGPPSFADVNAPVVTGSEVELVEAGEIAADIDHEMVSIQLRDQPTELRGSSRYQSNSVRSLAWGEEETGSRITGEEDRISQSMRRAISLQIPDSAFDKIEDTDNMEDGDLLSYLQANSTARHNLRSQSANFIHGISSLADAQGKGREPKTSHGRDVSTDVSSERSLGSGTRALTWGPESGSAGRSRRDREVGSGGGEVGGDGRSLSSSRREASQQAPGMLSSFRAWVWGAGDRDLAMVAAESEQDRCGGKPPPPTGPDAV